MSKWLSAPLLIVAINVLWLAGGQGYLWARRFLIAPLMASYAYFAQKETKKRRFALIFLALIGLLSMGYGENSWLKRACRGSETWTRVAMACLISSVFLIYCALTHHITPMLGLTFALNIGAWQVRAGRLCQIGKYDILIEDICRATALAVSLIIS